MQQIETVFTNWEYHDYTGVADKRFGMDYVVFPVENFTSEKILTITTALNELPNALKKFYPNTTFQIILCIKNIHHYLHFDKGIDNEIKPFCDPDGVFCRRFLPNIDKVITTTSTGLYQEQDLGFFKVIKI